jgi:N-glycosylase/DNA lyase
MKRPVYIETSALQREYAEKHAAIQTRLREFSNVRAENYVDELIYCLMTPQSSAVNAAKAIRALSALGPSPRPKDIARALKSREFYIRFHNTKARRIHEAMRRRMEITAVLTNGRSSEELRTWLVDNVNGLGWKEASHFLRNIGHRGLAILDRHILKNLRRHRVIRVVPTSLTAQRYLMIEEKYRSFAGQVRIGMDELDLLFWSRETGEILK